MSVASRVLTIPELETMLFFTVRYALAQKSMVPPEVATLVERHGAYLSIPMMEELACEITGLLPSAKMPQTEARVWEALSARLLRAAKKRKGKNGRSSSPG